MIYLQFREPFNAWSHGLWLILSLPATYLLWKRCDGDRAKRLSLLVFGLTMSACYLGSMLNHGVRLKHEGIDFFDRLDHIGIHLLIAGTYTPLAWSLMRGPWRYGTLAAVWTTTLVGSGLLLANIRLPVPLATCEYMALGWGALLIYVQMARVLTHKRMTPLVFGGICYTIGAVINVMHWPAPWPGVIGPHGVFHLWVMAGSTFHFWFMLTAVVPVAACVPMPTAQPIPAWQDESRREPRSFHLNPITGRLHQG